MTRCDLDNHCKAPVDPERPELLRGPEVGTYVVYRDPAYPRWHNTVCLVKARSYVWAPNEHYGDVHGYRHYDWTVIWTDEPDADVPGGIRSMVVDDDKLEPLRLGTRVAE